MLHATAVRPCRIFDLGVGRSHSVTQRTERRQVRRCDARNADLYMLRPTGPIGFVVLSACAATACALAPRLISSEAKRFGEEYRGGDGVGCRKLSLSLSLSL